MKGQALGLIEAVGLPAAIEAADAAVKAADVSLVGYEKTKGGGLILVKLVGNVGAVKSAVEAGVTAALKVGKVYAHHVIPHPHNDTQRLIHEIDRGPVKTPPAPEAAPVPGLPIEPSLDSAPEPEAEPELPSSPLDSVPALAGTVVEFIAPVTETPLAETPAAEEASPVEEASVVEDSLLPPTLEGEPGEVCNLCGDPTCPRRKGQPHRMCKHNNPDEEGPTF